MIKIKKSILNNQAFTIVELLVVIVVIGILAAITIISYSGISNKAITAGLQSDLDNDAKLLKMYNVEYGYYPSALDTMTHCPTTPTVDSRYCLKASTDTDLTYTGGGQSFTVTATKNSIKYQVTESSSPSIFQGLTGPDWITIGTQTWAKANLNVGTMINGTTSQTNNSILEKYCYGNTESNCTTYGGYYQWNEAMQYVATEGTQGICPLGSHIPSDNDWKILEKQLGMTQLEADKTNAWRGTDQGTQLKIGGGSGLNIPLSGYRNTDSSFSGLSWDADLWSSSESGSDARGRGLDPSNAGVVRDIYDKTYGFSVRCVGN